MNLLFMCVANSARSQMAEGLARNLMKEKEIKGKVQSAGSEPSSLNSRAIQVMAEIGIDISMHTSKSVEEIDEKGQVKTVITLCAEEVCPAYIGSVQRLHWGFSDPANPSLSSAEQLKLFRKVRDELNKKLEVFFEEGP